MNSKALPGIGLLTAAFIVILALGAAMQATAEPRPAPPHPVLEQPIPTEEQADLLGTICVGTAGLLLVVGGWVGLVQLTRRKEVL